MNGDKREASSWLLNSTVKICSYERLRKASTWGRLEYRPSSCLLKKKIQAARKLTADCVKNWSLPPLLSPFFKASTRASAVSEASASVARYSRFKGFTRLLFAGSLRLITWKR